MHDRVAAHSARARCVRRVHMKNCEFVDMFLRRFGRFISEFDTTYYYFCDPQVSVAGNGFVNGQSFDLVAETGVYLTRVVSDHARNITQLDELIGSDFLPKCVEIYNVCEVSGSRLKSNHSPRSKLLWASRLDSQKRPHLLPMISHLLKDKGLDIAIDAYGGSTYGVVGEESLAGGVKLTYRGNYDGFSTLPISNYDAFLYTAAFDGLPNVVLEAMGAGLPVIAPDVGGISEAVNEDTGYLVRDDADDMVVAQNFANAIASLYGAWKQAKLKGENGCRLVMERHSAANFSQRVSDVFNIS